MRGLGNSNEDVVFLVLGMLRASTSTNQFLKDLQSLSLTSRHLRDICLPVIFRIFRRKWDASVRKRKEILPLTLCHHVTVFELDVSATGDILVDEPTDLSKRLAAVFSQMERLQTFRLMNSAERGPWPALLKALFTIPSLTCLEIWDSAWRRPEEKFTREQLGLPQQCSPLLQKFVYRVPFTGCFPRESESYGRRDIIMASVELSNLLVLTSLICDAVEVLELPAELAVLLSEFVYPKLRVLTVQGHEPPHSPEWTTLFHSAPRLREFHLQTPTRSTEWSQKGHRTLLSQPYVDDRTMRSIYNLDSLTLSNPLGKDLFFQLLPYANLRTLSLKTFPLPDILGARWSTIRARVLTSGEVLCLLNAVQLAGLSTFELSYVVDSEDSSMLFRINSSFPGLETLEVHRYRPLARNNLDYDPLASMPKAIATMANLRHLKLNLDFPERPRCTDWRHNNPESYKSFQVFLEKEISIVFARNAPRSLKILGILSHDAFSSYWMVWEISKSRGLVGQQRRLGVIGNH